MAPDLASAFIGLAGAIVGGLISSSTAVLLHWRDRGKYREEHAWDTRRKAYTEIIGALDRARALAAHIDAEYQDDPHQWDASDNNRRAQVQMVEHFHAARAAFHANRLMLSRAFIAKYEQMNRDLGEGDNPNLIPPEAADIAAQVMERTVPDFEALAWKELGVKEPTS